MITDLWIVATDEALLLDVPAPQAARLATRLDSLIFAEDVQVEEVSAEMPCTLIMGARLVAPELAGDAGRAKAGAGVLIPDDTYGVPGLVAYGDLDVLLDAHGLTWLRGAPQVSLDTFDVLRIGPGCRSSSST
jgi:hypothetical protein